LNDDADPHAQWSVVEVVLESEQLVPAFKEEVAVMETHSMAKCSKVPKEEDVSGV
jgi:hypothetical protein